MSAGRRRRLSRVVDRSVRSGPGPLGVRPHQAPCGQRLVRHRRRGRHRRPGCGHGLCAGLLRRDVRCAAARGQNGRGVDLRWELFFTSELFFDQVGTT